MKSHRSLCKQYAVLFQKKLQNKKVRSLIDVFVLCIFRYGLYNVSFELFVYIVFLMFLFIFNVYIKAEISNKKVKRECGLLNQNMYRVSN